MDLIEQDLQSILPSGGTLSGPLLGRAMGTAGREADSIRFHHLARDRTTAAADLPDEGFRQTEIVLKTDYATPALVRRVNRNLLASAAVEPTEEVLATDVIGFSVRYYDGYGWLTEWDSTLQGDALPLAVQITLRKNPARDASSQTPYALTRIVPLPCATEATDAQQ
jgi:hypothetical protein